MEGERVVLITSNYRMESGRKTPIILLLILWSMGIIDWSPPRSERSEYIFLCPIIGRFRFHRRPVFIFSVLGVFTLAITAYFGAFTFFMCYAGLKERLLRFMFVVVCYWPPLMCGSVFLLLAFVKNKCCKSNSNRKKLSWVMLLHEATVLERLSCLKNSKMYPLPKPWIFVFFHFCGLFVSCVVVLFYIVIYKSCLTWLSYLWMSSELIGLMYLTNFSYILYLQRIILEEEYKQTENFIEINVGQLDSCTKKVSDCFCNYYRLRKLFFRWLSIIFFSITFGVAAYGTWFYSKIYSSASPTTSPTQFPLQPQGIKKSCPYSCDDPTYLKNQHNLVIFNIVAFAKLFTPAVLAFSVTRGLNITNMWNRLILTLRLMSATENSDFWYRLIKYAEDLHPKTSMDIKMTFIFPVIGLFFGFLGGWKNMNELN